MLNVDLLRTSGSMKESGWGHWDFYCIVLLVNTLFRFKKNQICSSAVPGASDCPYKTLDWFFSACIFSSFVQDSMVNLIGLKNTYIFGLSMFGVSMFFTVIFPSVVVLNICAAFSGLGFAVATTIPCTLITRYHEQPELFFRDTRNSGDFSAGIGGDMAVLDSTYYLSQIILSVFMGKLVEATGLPHFYIAISSLCGFLAAIMATRVAFTPSDFNKAIKS
jgi:MFS family permease